jgi:hypothetical protein
VFRRQGYVHDDPNEGLGNENRRLRKMYLEDKRRAEIAKEYLAKK